MWIPGTAVVITVTNTKQLLIPTPNGTNLVKAIRLMGDTGNAGSIYWGTSALDVTTTPKAGVLGWLPKPSATINPIDIIYEHDAINGINLAALYVTGTQGDAIIWSFIQQ